MTPNINQSTSHLSISSRRVISFGTLNVTRPKISNTKPDSDGIIGVQQLQEYQESVAVEFTCTDSDLIAAGTKRNMPHTDNAINRDQVASILPRLGTAGCLLPNRGLQYR